MKTVFDFYIRYLNTFMVLAIAVGGLIGYCFPETAMTLGFPGDLFIRALKLLIVPIIFVSMLAGILGLEKGNELGRVGLKTFTYYMVTTALAVITGLVAVNVMQPGKSDSFHLSIPPSDTSESAQQGGLLKVLMNIVPENIVHAASTENVLGLIFFAIFLGVALRHAAGDALPTVSKPITVLFDALIWMVDRVMIIAPFGIVGLIAPLVGETVMSDEFAELGKEIQWYFVTVLSGLIIHGVITLPLLLYLSKINPVRFFLAMFPAVSTAFSTASSSATLPVTIDSLQSRAGVPDKYAGFVAPLGATVNMDGTAIYEAVAALFIANIYGIDLTFSQQCIIFLTATFSAIGAAGIPGAGLIMMTMILGAVGLPADGIKLIVVVDRILDMVRTGLNVWGDSIGAAIIARSEGASLEFQDH